MTTKLESLMKRIEELEKAAKPAEPFVPGPRFQFDPTAGASMPPSALRAMVNAIPESLMSELRADALKPNPIHASSSTVSGTPSPQPQRRGTGWRDEVPLGPQPGIEHVDRLVDAQDKIDKAELALKFAQAEMSKSK